MRATSVIRAWKDDEYRLSLSDSELALLPEHPAGAIELTDAELGATAGAAIVPLASLVCASWMLPCPSGYFSCRCLPF